MRARNRLLRKDTDINREHGERVLAARDEVREQAKVRKADRHREMMIDLAAEIIRRSSVTETKEQSVTRSMGLALRIDREIAKLSPSVRAQDGVLFREWWGGSVGGISAGAKRDTAYHEASHAVFAVSAGITFTEVLMHESGGGVLNVTTELLEHDFASQIMLYHVGCIGAAQFQSRAVFRKHALESGWKDREHLRAIIAKLHAEWHCMGSAEVIEAYFEERALEFVKANIEKIRAVGEALFMVERLTEFEVMEIINSL